MEVPGRDIQKCEDAPGFNVEGRTEVVRVSTSKSDAFQVVLVEDGPGVENGKKSLELAAKVDVGTARIGICLVSTNRSHS
jgi:hypothetical protein